MGRPRSVSKQHCNLSKIRWTSFTHVGSEEQSKYVEFWVEVGLFLAIHTSKCEEGGRNHIVIDGASMSSRHLEMNIALWASIYQCQLAHYNIEEHIHIAENQTVIHHWTGYL